VPADAIKLALTRSDPQAAAERLILEARKQGGPDNITAVVVRLDEGPHAAAGDSEEATLVRPADPEAEEVTGELPFVVDAPEADDPAGDAADALAAQAAALRAEDEGHPESGPATVAARRRTRTLRRLWVAAVLLVLLTAALATGAYTLTTVYYVGVDDGSLAIFSGVPAKVGPLPLHAVYRRSHVSYDTLSPTAKALVDEQQLSDRQDALELGTTLGMFR
jgi:protein phosphatase